MSDKFDNNIKNAFDGLEDDMNPDLIWKGISTKMETPKKKKRRFVLWWGLGLVFGLILLSAFLFIKKSPITEDNVSFSHLKNEIPMDIEEVSNVSNEKTVSEQTEVKLNNKLKLTYESKVSIPNQTINRIFSNGNKNSIDTITNKYLINDDNIDENIISFKTADDTYINKVLVDKLIEHPILAVKQKLAPTTRNNVPNLSILDGLDLSILKSDISFRGELLYPQIPLLNSSKNNRWFGYFEIYKGLSIGSKSFVSSNEEYTTQRNASEQFLEQIHAGFRLQMVHFLGFEVLAGAKYTRVNDRWKIDLQYHEDRLYTYIDHQTEFPNGNIEDHFTTESLEHGIVRYIEQYNTEQLVSIPLEMRYGMLTDNWTFSLGAGLEISYLFASEQKVIGIDGMPTIDTKGSQWLSPTMTLGIYTAYKLSPNWSITGNLNYKQLSIVNSSLLPDLQSNYSMYGIELGISRNLH